MLATFSSITELVDNGERDVGADSNHLYHVVVFVTHHTNAIHLVEVEERGRGREVEEGKGVERREGGGGGGGSGEEGGRWRREVGKREGGGGGEGSGGGEWERGREVEEGKGVGEGSGKEGGR